jgi:DNA-binding beta-propeller fold protein YncE
MKMAAVLVLPAPPVDMDVVQEGNRAAVSFGGAAAPVIVNLTTEQLEATVKAVTPVSIVRLQSNGKQLVAAHQDEKMLSFYAVPSGEVVTRLPLAINPKNLCFKQDGGQLFITGDGMDAVVIVYPYRTEVRETVLAGHMPGVMAAVTTDDFDFLLVANPSSGDVTIMNVATTPLKVVGIAPVGKGPGFIVITPDNQYALVLNQESGDMAVIRLKNVAQNRAKKAPLFTMIPVGSKPVSAVVRVV